MPSADFDCEIKAPCDAFRHDAVTRSRSPEVTSTAFSAPPACMLSLAAHCIHSQNGCVPQVVTKIFVFNSRPKDNVRLTASAFDAPAGFLSAGGLPRPRRGGRSRRPEQLIDSFCRGFV